MNSHEKLVCVDIETVPDRTLIPDWDKGKCPPKPVWHRVVAISFKRELSATATLPSHMTLRAAVLEDRLTGTSIACSPNFGSISRKAPREWLRGTAKGSTFPSSAPAQWFMASPPRRGFRAEPSGMDTSSGSLPIGTVT